MPGIFAITFWKVLGFWQRGVLLYCVPCKQGLPCGLACRLSGRRVSLLVSYGFVRKHFFPISSILLIPLGLAFQYNGPQNRGFWIKAFMIDTEGRDGTSLGDFSHSQPQLHGNRGKKKKVGRIGSWAFKKYYHSITDILSGIVTVLLNKS